MEQDGTEFIFPRLERRYLMLGGDTDPVLVPKGFQDPKGPWMGLQKKAQYSLGYFNCS